MRKVLVLAVALVSFLMGASLSPFVSAAGQQDATLLASLPKYLKQGERLLFEPHASAVCDVIRQNGVWVECEGSLYVNLATGVSYRISLNTK